MAVIISTENRYRQWHISEIYQGVDDPAKNLYVPRPNDTVFDPNTGLLVVEEVNEVNNIPKLVKWVPTAANPADQSDDLAAALSKNARNAIHDAYFDDGGERPVITLDIATYFYDKSADKLILFEGTDTSEDGTIISRTYSSGGALISEHVVLEKLFADNDSIKRPATITVDRHQEPGSIVTAVTFTTSGREVQKQSYRVMRASVMRPLDLDNKYVTGVELISGLIDPNTPDVLITELNTPLNTADMRCRLHYNTGQTLDVGIDGDKVKLAGLNDFNESILSTGKTLTLAYYPDLNEAALNMSSGNTTVITKQYTVVTHRPDSSYAFKLFVVPEYKGVTDGYDLKWYLLNVERDLIQDATAFVSVSNKATTGPYNPMNYDSEQRLTVNMRIEDMLPGIAPDYVLVQELGIRLRAPGVADVDPWVIDYSNDASASIGADVVCEANNALATFTIQNGLSNLATWREALYTKSLPIYDASIVSAPPWPTHFEVRYGDNKTATFSIDQWHADLDRVDVVNFTEGDTMEVVWIYRETPAGANQYLGVTPLYIRTTA